MIRLRMKLLFLAIPIFAIAAFSADPNSSPAPADSAAPKLEHFDPTLPDMNLDPCTDFYKYSCSKWISSNPIPADQVA